MPITTRNATAPFERAPRQTELNAALDLDQNDAQATDPEESEAQTAPEPYRGELAIAAKLSANPAALSPGQCSLL